ncbi:MAG: BPL-N domain-containing protein [Bdellovibrionales bacterium]
MNVSLFVLILASIWSPVSGAQSKILIYDGPGACEDCAREISALLKGKGYQAEIIRPEQVTEARLKQASLYIQPGGDNTMNVRNALGKDKLALIKNYVLKGGNYLGICLGAVLASTDQDDDGSPMLGLLPVSSVEANDMAAKVVPVTVSSGGFGVRHTFVQDPPTLKLLNSKAAVQILARYANGGIAGVSGSAGKGKAVIFGPHFEASKNWAEFHKLKDPDGQDEQDVFMHFVRMALPASIKPVSAPASGKTAR